MSSKRYEGHTVGAWEIYTADIENTGDCDIYSVDGDYVAVAVLDGNVSRRDANAALIAAAPMLLRQRDELLAQCKNVLDEVIAGRALISPFEDKTAYEYVDEAATQLMELIARIEAEEAQS